MNSMKIIGGVITILGLGFLFAKAFWNFTGFVIFEKIYALSVYSALIGLGLLVAGLLILLFSGREREKKEQIEGKEGGLEKKTNKILLKMKRYLDAGKIGSYGELLGFARKLGYDLREGRNWTLIYDKGNIIAKVPRHSRGVATGTYRSALKNLYEHAIPVAA